MAGEDFTEDEMTRIHAAVIAAGVMVSLSEAGGDQEEMFALQQAMRGARLTARNQFVRKVASEGGFPTGLRTGTKFAQYEGPALEEIRWATATVSRKAPDDLPAFQAFVVEMAEAAANAHREGGFGGFGGVQVSAREQAAIDEVKKALGLS
ncbi:MAG TPA: hypothetical protein VGO86_01625 [Candidatus Dormibacteraeota bacterium]